MVNKLTCNQFLTVLQNILKAVLKYEYNIDHIVPKIKNTLFTSYKIAATICALPLSHVFFIKLLSAYTLLVWFSKKLTQWANYFIKQCAFNVNVPKRNA